MKINEDEIENNCPITHDFLNQIMEIADKRGNKALYEKLEHIKKQI